MAALNKKVETFVVYVAARPAISIHLMRETHIGALIAKEALSKIPVKYLDYTNIFSLGLVMKLPEYTSINNHVINFVAGK